METPVLTENGAAAIEGIKAGDLVYSEDRVAGGRGLRRVVRTFASKACVLVHVAIGGGTLSCTPEHPFYVVGRGWASAGELEAGDEVALRSGGAALVGSVRHETLAEPATVYNLEVEGWHTYYVGDAGVLVHNMCGGADALDDILDDVVDDVLDDFVDDVVDDFGRTGIGNGGVGNAIRPEAKYTGSGKHGVKWNEGPATAKNLNKAQGQWSQKDLDFATQKAITLKPGENSWFDLPSDSTSVVHMPNGTTVPATKIWIRNNGTGTFHGYPST
jgi:hypothetical protein